jgi:membrane peptidoglycan carboxypeptidase
MFTRFGFGRKTGIGLAGEVRGLLHPLKRWGEIEFATNAFGQGLTVTPLQMATAFSAIATGGVYKPPRLALRLVHPDGRSEPLPPHPEGRAEQRVVSEKTARLMLEIMRGVTVKGSGTRAAIPGYPVAGKTGTAQKTAGGRYVDRYVGSFIGIAPSDKPRVVVGVWIDEPTPEHLGGLVAAPVFREITEAVLRYLTVLPSEPIVVVKGKAGAPPGAGSVPAGGEKARSAAGGGTASAGGDSSATLAAALVASPADLDANDADEGPGTDQPLIAEGEGLLGELDEEEGAEGDEATAAEAEGAGRDEAVTVPSFAGMSLGQAVRAARRAGVELVPDGSGVAVTQSPAPGLVPRGAICRVVFRPRG